MVRSALRAGLILAWVLGLLVGAASGPQCLAQTIQTTLAAQTAKAPTPIKVTFAYCTSGGKQGLAVRIGLSQPIELAELKAHLVALPEVPKMEIVPEGDSTFGIYGEWLPVTDYEIRINPGLKDLNGVEHDERISTHVKTDAVSPYIGFDLDGKYYIPRRGKLDLNVESRKIDEAEVKLSRMFPSNLAVALDGIQKNGDVYSDFSEKWCEETAKWKLDLGGGDQLKKNPVNLMKHLDRKMRGVYCLSVKGTVRQGTRPGQSQGEGEDGDYSDERTDAKVVILTNLGLVAHWRDRELVLFVQDLYTVKPVWRARVTVWSARNQILGVSHTGLDGVAAFKDFNGALGKPKVVVVECGDDYTFLELTPRPEDKALVDGSLSPYDRKGYDGFIYADRELYRPGEKIHLRWIVRKNFGGAAAGVPLLLNVLKPNGKTLLSRPTLLSEMGTGELDLPTLKTYPTGTYTVRLTLPGEESKTVGSYTFYLEEFVPSRMKATVDFKDERWLAWRNYEFTVNGQHLFGAPASGRKAEALLQLDKADFHPAQWKEYRFGNDTAFTRSHESLGEAQTDKDGNARFSYTWKPAAQVTFPLRGTLLGKVFEPGGRAVTAKKNMTLFPSNVCLGLTAVPAGKTGEVVASVAAIGVDESPATLASVKLTLEKQVWNYYVRRYYSNLETNWSPTYEALETREVKLTGGRGEASFKVPGYGYYRLRVHSEATAQFSTIDFYSWDGQCELVDASRPSLIKVTPNKASYEPGETAEVKIESPFNGRALVVLEGDSFHDTFSTEIKDNVGRVRFKIRSEYFPGVWLQATVVHSIQQKPMLISPFSSFALAPLQVVDRSRQLTLSFPSLPKEIRPAQNATFEVKVLDNKGRPVRESELTLAAVDEGIHLTTGYQSPNPWAWLSRMRGLDLRRAHYYDKVAYDFDKPEPGGDLNESGMGKRLGEPSENWIKTVALWSGPVRTDRRGVAKVSFAVPEFTGQLRLVAVACTKTALGAQAGSIFIRRPYMLQTSQPRFLLPGDSFRTQSVLYNHSEAPCTARITWTTSGSLETAKGEQDLPLPAHGEATFAADLQAGQLMGPGRIVWNVSFLDAAGKRLDQLAEEVPIPVIAPAAFAAETELTILKPGETREFRNTKFVDNKMAELDLTVGASVMLRLQEALGYVLDYPYGCVEQTTSRLLPLYLVRQSTSLMATIKGKTQRDLDDMIRGGIDRLFSMQTASGGLACWPGDTTPYDYGSIYALHALTLIKNDRVIEVPQENFKALQRYVRDLSQDWSKDDMPDLYERAYAVYVLALGGDLDALHQIKRFDHVMLPRAARYLLAAVLAQNTQDLERVRKYLEDAPVKPWEVREQARTLNSDIRNAAIELLALRQMKTATPEELARRADELVRFLTRNHYGTTQETAFIITALSGYLADVTRNIESASVTVTDPEGRQKMLKGAEVYQGHAEGPGRVFRLANTGPTEVYVNLATHGIPLKPDLKPLSKGLTVSRLIYDKPTTASTTLKFRQTDNLIVRLCLDCAERVSVKNVILTDILPAGFEIENPRLDPDAVPDRGFGDTVNPSYLEIRDDRLVLAFDELTPGKHYFNYLVRTVTPGRFQQPAVAAECMYDPLVRGRSAVGTVEISPVGTSGK